MLPLCFFVLIFPRQKARSCQSLCFFCVSARNHTSRENCFAQFPKLADWNIVENKDGHHYHQYHHNYHQVMLTTRNVFIATLAVSDILLCSFCMPLTLVDILTNYWTLGQNMVWNWSLKLKEVTKIPGDSLQVDRSDPVDVRLLLLLLDPAHRLWSLLLHRPPHWKSDLYQTGGINNMFQNHIIFIRSRSNRQKQHVSKWYYFYQISIKQATTTWIIMILFCSILCEMATFAKKLQSCHVSR